MRVEILQSDDWEGLYIDGALIIEGHRLPASQVLAVVAPLLRFDTALLQADEEWLEDAGSFPLLLRDAKTS